MRGEGPVQAGVGDTEAAFFWWNLLHLMFQSSQINSQSKSEAEVSEFN